MKIRCGCRISIDVFAPTATVCMVNLRPDFPCRNLAERFSINPPDTVRSGEDIFGNKLQRFVAYPGRNTVSLENTIDVSGTLDHRPSHARLHTVEELPTHVMTFLNASRYCDVDKLATVAWSVFGGLKRDLSLVEAICDFAHSRLLFDYQFASSERTAAMAYYERVGVCRDFAHLAITLCRALNIPARYVNGYMGDIGVRPDPSPMDFNAWFDVFVEGQWVTFDARHNCRRIGRLPIAYGRDACDVPIISTFGQHYLSHFSVVTEEVDVAKSSAA